MANEIGKIKTLSQYISGTKTELYPRTLMEAITDQNGDSLDLVILSSIETKLNEFVNGELGQSYVKKGEVYTKEEIDSKLEDIDLSQFVTVGQLANKADKNHRHDDIYAEIEHTHSEYITRSILESNNTSLKKEIIGDAPDGLNTLELIASAINNDNRFYETMKDRLSEKVSTEKFEEELENYSPIDHLHSEYYDKSLLYTKKEIDDLLLNLDLDIDLSGYATLKYVDDKIKKIDDNLITNYLTSEEIYSELYNKVDKQPGKQLSTEDFTKELKSKLEDIEDNANYYEHPEYHNVSEIRGLHTVATSGNYTDLEDTPTSLSQFDNDCNFVDSSTLNSSISDINNTIGELDERITDNTSLIESTKSELENEISESSTKFNKKIDEIYGGESAKTELEGYGLENLLAFAASIDYNPYFKGYVDELFEDSNSSMIEFKEVIDEIYGGDSAKTELEGYGLESLLKLAASINYNPDFKGYVDGKDEELNNEVDIVKKDIVDIYGGDSAKTELEGYGLESLIKISSSIDHNSDFKGYVDGLKNDSNNMIDDINDEIVEIYGGENAKSILAGYELDSLLKLAASIDYNPDFKGYVDEMNENSNSSMIEFKETIEEIYGGENAKNELVGYGLESLLKLAASIDYNPDFKGYVDGEIQNINSDADNIKKSHKEDINEIYGGENAKTELEGYGLGNLLLISNAIDNNPDFSSSINNELSNLNTIIESKVNEIYGNKESLPDDLNSLSEIADALGGDASFATNLSLQLNEINEKHKTDINEIYGGENAKTALAGYELDSLLKLAASIDYNPDFKGYVDEKLSEETDSSMIEFRDTVNAIYGGSDAKAELVGYNLESLLKLAAAIDNDSDFHTTIRNEMSSLDEAVYAQSKSYTDKEIADLIGTSPELLNTLEELADALGRDENFATTVTDKIAEIQRLVENLKGGNLPTDLDTILKITNKISDIESTVTDNSINISTNTANISGLRIDIEGIDKSIVEINDTLESHGQNIIDNSNDITTIKSNILSITKTVTELDTEVDTNTQSISDINSEITSIKSLLGNSNTSISSIVERLDSAEQNISTNESEISGLKSDVSNIDKSIERIDETLETYEQNITSNTEEISSLKSSVVEINKDITIIYNDIDTHEQSISDINGIISNIKSNISNINKDIEGIDKSILEINDSLAAHEQGISENNKSIGTINTNITKIENSITSINESLESVATTDNVESLISQAKKDLRGNVEDTWNTMEKIKSETEGIQNSLSNQIESTKTEINKSISDINKALTNLETDYQDADQSLKVEFESADTGLRNYIDKSITDLINNADESFSTLGDIQSSVNDMINVVKGSPSSNYNTLGKIESRIEEYVEQIYGVDIEDITSITSNNINDISNQLEILNSIINGGDSEVGSISSRLSGIESDVEELETQVLTHSNDISSLQSAIGRINSADNGILKQAKDYTDEQIISITNSITENNGKISKLETSVKANTDKIAELEGSMSDTSGILEQANKNASEKDAAILAQAKQFTTDSIDSIVSDISDLSSRITSANTNIGKLSDEIDQLELSIVESLDQANEYTDGKISDLIGKDDDDGFNTLKGIQYNIELLNSNVDTDLTALESKVDKFKEEYTKQVTETIPDLIEQSEKNSTDYTDTKIASIKGKEEDTEFTSLKGIEYQFNELDSKYSGEIQGVNGRIDNLRKDYNTQITETIPNLIAQSLTDAKAYTDTEISRLEGKDEDTDPTSIKGLAYCINNIDSKYNGQIEDLEKSIINLQNADKDINDKLGEFDEYILRNNGNISSISSDITNIKKVLGSCESLEDELGSVLNDANSYTDSQIESIKGKNTDEGFNTLKGIESNILALENKHGEDITGLTGELDTLKTSFNKYKNEEFPLIQEEIENNSKKYTNAQISLIKGNTDDEGSTTIAGLANQIDSLNIKMNEMKNDNDALEKIYGTSLSSTFEYDSVKELSDAISDGGIFYNDVVSKDSEVLRSANSFTSSSVSSVIGSAQKYTNLGSIENEIELIREEMGDLTFGILGEVSDEYNTLEKIEGHIVSINEYNSDNDVTISELEDKINEAAANNTEILEDLETISQDIEKIYGNNGRNKKYNNIASINSRLSAIYTKSNTNEILINTISGEISLIYTRLNSIESYLWGSSSSTATEREPIETRDENFVYNNSSIAEISDVLELEYDIADSDQKIINEMRNEISDIKTRLTTIENHIWGEAETTE